MLCSVLYVNFIAKVPNIAKLGSYKSIQYYQLAVRCNSSDTIMKVLNVAEKNDAAKNIAGHLSRGTSNRVIEIVIFIRIYDTRSKYI